MTTKNTLDNSKTNEKNQAFQAYNTTNNKLVNSYHTKYTESLPTNKF